MGKPFSVADTRSDLGVLISILTLTDESKAALCVFELEMMSILMQVRDLENLIGLYSEWHSRLLPYYSFDQFVHKVEQVAATKRVKVS